MKNVISIDWEDWFHICGQERVLPRKAWDSYDSILDEATDAILDRLDQRRARATFFIVGYSARRLPEAVKRISDAGHEIAFHTMEHSLVYEMNSRSLSHDLDTGKALLQELTGQTILGFRAPQWSLGRNPRWVYETLAAHGFEYDSSAAPLSFIGDQRGPLHARCVEVDDENSITEFPPLVLETPAGNLPAGGGWGLRTWPMRRIIGKVRRLNATGSPATFYFHPAEFVERKLPANLSPIKRFVCSFRLRSAAAAWDALFDTLEFGTMGEAAAALRTQCAR